jgi:tripartite ATP-independent transporter DctP family solute receptor
LARESWPTRQVALCAGDDDNRPLYHLSEEEREMMRKTILAAGAACVLLFAGQVMAESYRAEYRLSTVLGTAFPWGQAGERWAELVKEKTQGRIVIKLYPGTSLVGGDQTREFTAIRQGTIDMAIGSTINWSPQVKELNLFALPFLMPDYKAIDVLTQGEVGKELFGVLESREVVPLAWGENGFREMSNSKHAVATPADMKGLKFRVVGSPLFNETFSAIGANPTQMSWADAQPALASGAVDGQENPLSVFVAAKLPTVGQKYLTLWHYVADPLIFVVNRDVWASWTAADREAVRQAALQAGRENVAAARKGIAGSDNAVLKQIEASGVTVTSLTDEQRAAFVKLTRPTYEKWAKSIGPDLVKKAEAAIAKR